MQGLWTKPNHATFSSRSRLNSTHSTTSHYHKLKLTLHLHIHIDSTCSNYKLFVIFHEFMNKREYIVFED